MSGHKQGCIHVLVAVAKLAVHSDEECWKASWKATGKRGLERTSSLQTAPFATAKPTFRHLTPESDQRRLRRRRKKLLVMCCLCTGLKWVYLNLRSPQTSHPIVGTSISGTEIKRVQPHEPKTHSEVSGFVESSEVPFYLNLPFCHIE